MADRDRIVVLADGRASDAASDATARERALDATRSFLVQAPAGSGKTELLIQRFLALLSHVERPEQIVAMTFTRKAAGEMRERVVGALTDALARTPVESAHGERTRALALAALDADRRHRWQLIDHPARLAMFTIDAFAARLATQAPLATGLGGSPRYEEHAEAHYAAAARAALAAAKPDDAAWRSLLAHVDNDAAHAIRLLADMLAKRDQWIGEMGGANPARLRAALEATLAVEIEAELAAVAARFPPALVAELVDLQRYAAANLAEATDSAQLSRDLAACADAGGLPPPIAAEHDRWRALANWLLVSKNPQFRVAKAQGFPAIGKSPERRMRNEAMCALLADLAAIDGLADALHDARRLPGPSYADDAWAFIEVLLQILPRVAAELTLTFRAAGTIDFTQGLLAALEALGDDDNPSDLLLKLDYRISHLLVDEFQDTSYSQLDLIRRVTAGWQPGDGRTVFAVGDPMQSIYRFRGAEVRLFVEAQQSGRIGHLPVENLVLRHNFRSDPELVEWTNRVFPGVLGRASDPWRGVVGFVPAVAACPSRAGAAVTVEVFADAQSEARAVVGHAQAALDDEAESVAILVRARAHLDVLLPELRAAGILYAAVDLDVLGQRQAIQDLLSLTHALVQPADRLAWLAVLRAPWCGLSLPDLFAVVGAADGRFGGSIAALIDEIEPIDELSAEGRKRFARLASVLKPALDARGRAGVASRVRGAWLALGGGATLAEAIDVEATEKFYACVEAHDVGGDIPEWSTLVAALAWLNAEADVRSRPRVQVMTLHRAKGLQFDTVILPGLARAPNRGDDEILRWRRRPRGLLLASMKARGGETDAVYRYLRRLADVEESSELGRLLYVGATRAERRVHLTGVLPSVRGDGGEMAWDKPAAGTALEKFWPLLGERLAPPVPAAPSSAVARASRPLRRLPAEWSMPPPAEGVPAAALPGEIEVALPFDWAREAARHVGTVAHRVLAEIAREGIESWIPLRVAGLGPRIRAELLSEGVDEIELAPAVASVIDAVAATLGDPRGQWLFDPGHAEAKSEWALGGWNGNVVTHVVVDRTFVAEGVRWIVDFKTGSHEGADRDGFLDRERERYRAQLEQYAAFVRRLDARPIRLGLYHPLIRGWREWAYEES
jgi:ATP-dependent exoDNAse (exonuclease V) beta subunit